MRFNYSIKEKKALKGKGDIRGWAKSSRGRPPLRRTDDGEEERSPLAQIAEQPEANIQGDVHEDPPAKKRGTKCSKYQKWGSPSKQNFVLRALGETSRHGISGSLGKSLCFAAPFLFTTRY